MKKQFLTLSLVTWSLISLCQWNPSDANPDAEIWRNGNIGIGTNNPLEKFHIQNNIENGIGPVFLLQNSQYSNSTGAGSAIKFLGASSTGTINRYVQLEAIMRVNSMPDNLSVIFNNNGDIIKPLTVKYTGNVGIGTDDPLEKFHIQNNVENGIGPVLLLQNSQYSNSTGAGSAIKFLGANSTGTINRYVQLEAIMRVNSMPDNLSVVFNNNGDIIKPLIIKHTGSVGIGTYETGSHKLAVEGSIGAREIKVEATTWSDFVFYNDYKLKDLEEVENFINKNNHLPDVPSEKTVLENGIQLGEMNAILLQKIEELTLYIIEQNKKTDILVKKVALLEQKIKN